MIGCASTIFVAIRHYEHYFHLVYVVVQFYPWFKFYFLLFQTHYHTSYPYTITKESKIEPRRKIEPQHVRKQGIVFFARSDWLLKLAICSAIHLRATPNVSYVRNGFILNQESCSRENTKKATKFVLEAFTGELNPKTAFFKKKIDPDPMFY